MYLGVHRVSVAIVLKYTFEYPPIIIVVQFSFTRVKENSLKTLHWNAETLCRSVKIRIHLLEALQPMVEDQCSG